MPSSHTERAMVLAHKRGLEHARERSSLLEARKHAAIFPTQDERDAFLAGYWAETRRLFHPAPRT